MPVAKSLRTAIYTLLLALSLNAATWDPSGWVRDTSKSPQENLIALLAHLENHAATDDEFHMLELHFGSMRLLAETYTPSTDRAENLITTYSDPAEGAALFRYTRGDRQLVIAYPSTAGGVVSYVRFTLPFRWNPDIEYPVYVWARGGGPTPYPGDINSIYDEQISAGPIPGTPSGVYKDGYTVMPGALGGRAYTGDQEQDFQQGFDLFLSNFKSNPNRYYMGGFSNGGKGTYLIASATINKYNWAALGMCAPAVPNSQAIESIAAPLKNVPIWMAVGANDTQWKPTTHATRDILTAIGNPPEVYYEQAGIGHEWSWGFQVAMYEFLKSKVYTPPAPPPAEIDIIRSEDGKAHIRIQATDMLTARLESSTNLSTWGLLETINISSGETHLEEIQTSSLTGQTFFRLKNE